jgi:YD repeat-containing protein
MKYDCRNRLVSAGGTTYAYDAENNRISKTVDKIKTEYVIDSTDSLTRILTATLRSSVLSIRTL